MPRIPVIVIALSLAAVLAALRGMALAAQDRYTLQLPGGLSFSDFRGYEDWQVVSVSQTDDLLKVMVANPVMIEAYKAGIPGNGQPFPDGSKIAKIEWKPKKMTESPFAVNVPSTLQDVFLIEKDTKRFPTRKDGPTPCSTTIPRPTRSRPMRAAPSIAGSRATRSWRQKITFFTRTRSGERNCRPPKRRPRRE